CSATGHGGVTVPVSAVPGSEKTPPASFLLLSPLVWSTAARAPGQPDPLRWAAVAKPRQVPSQGHSSTSQLRLMAQDALENKKQASWSQCRPFVAARTADGYWTLVQYRAKTRSTPPRTAP